MVAANPLTAAPSDERIAPLEGVRGLMAWWVVLGHYAHTVGLTNPILENNALAVDVFVILSGFVITFADLEEAGALHSLPHTASFSNLPCLSCHPADLGRPIADLLRFDAKHTIPIGTEYRAP
ncbi:MAG: hypothetical protein Q7J26_01760 [Brevundimonas sp.]|uniref:acyltransferase family protein n=1 Tax=Brevundimonas sp. TaxID=1871086 RepID=UPI00272160EE|nr:hypothetical protein [Brevundimonas sp.]MDO9607223.1 hypothetical protein [Brevundimonas sp.]